MALRKTAVERVAEFDAEYHRTRIMELLRKGIEGPLAAAEELIQDLWVMHKKTKENIESGEELATKQTLSPAARLSGMLGTFLRMQIAIRKLEEGDADSSGLIPTPADASDPAVLAERCAGFFESPGLEDAGGEGGEEEGE